MLIGYARVSKGDDQSTALQRRALNGAGCERIFEEAASGGRWDRPELHRMIDQLRTGDVVTVWKLDRLSRSLKDLLHILDRIEAAGGVLRSLSENIDTTSSAGRMMMQMVGSFAEFERAKIRERTSAGLAQARAEGRVGGRRPKLTPSQRGDVVENERRQGSQKCAGQEGIIRPYRESVAQYCTGARRDRRADWHYLAKRLNPITTPLTARANPGMSQAHIHKSQIGPSCLRKSKSQR